MRHPAAIPARPLLCLLGLAACGAPAAVAAPAGTATDVAAVIDNGFAFPLGARPEVVAGDGRGGEGPAWDPSWGILTSGRGGIHRREPDGSESLFRADAGTNGLLFDREGRLLACEPARRRVTRQSRAGALEVLTDSYDGAPYNQPNDLALDSRGRIYFSDACYGGPEHLRQRTADGRPIEGVYRIDAPGKVTRLLGPDDVERANGVLVSADDRHLFVADNCNDRPGGARRLWRFALSADGTVEPGSRRLLFDWGEGRGPDGIKQDIHGHLYVAAGTTTPRPPHEPDTSRPGGIYVIHPDNGRLLAFLPVPRDEVTNCCFGGPDRRDLFITAGGTLFRVRTAHPGHVTWPAAGAAATAVGDRLLDVFLRDRTRQLTAACLTDIDSRAAWEQRRPQLVAQLHEMLGLDPLPPRTPLEPVVTGTVTHGDVVVERIAFQSLPGVYVTANLWRPRDPAGPLPTVLYLCGHAQVKEDGVSLGNKTAYQHHGGWFARNGYVCLVLDTLQLGEIEGLHHGTYRAGMWWWPSRGYTPAGVEAWNAIRALDYLQSRSDVDAGRLGVTGRSGGGATSWWVAALDDRIRVAVPVAGITTLTNHVVDGCIEGHCDCMYPVNTHGWDFPLVAALVAPRPLLLANTDADPIFPLDGVVELHGKLRGIYALHDALDRLGLTITAGPHKDTQELQLPAFVWFNRFLRDPPAAIPAPAPVVAEKLLPSRDLRVFSTLPTDERNSRIHESFVAAAAPPVPTTTADWDAGAARLLSAFREKCLGGWVSGASRSTEALRFGAREAAGVRWQEREILVAEPWRLRVETARAAAESGPPRRVVVEVLDPAAWETVAPLIAAARGDAAPSAATGAVTPDALARFQARCREPDTLRVFAAPRGVGPTEWSRDPRERTHLRRRLALLGETDDAGRVIDLHGILRSLRHDPSLAGADLEVVGSGMAAGWALLAALVADDDGLDGLRLRLTALPTSAREGPILLNLLRVMDMPHATALACRRHDVELFVPDTTAADAWEFATAVGRLTGRPPRITATAAP
jgi:sugar lactone lactonase YvrE/dienelactone hydrolase